MLYQIKQSYGYQLPNRTEFDDLARKITESATLNQGTLSDKDLLDISETAQKAEKLLIEVAKLKESLKERMQTVAPRVVEKLGEIVGARMIAKFGLKEMIEQQ